MNIQRQYKLHRLGVETPFSSHFNHLEETMGKSISYKSQNRERLYYMRSEWESKPVLVVENLTIVYYDYTLFENLKISNKLHQNILIEIIVIVGRHRLEIETLNNAICINMFIPTDIKR